MRKLLLIAGCLAVISVASVVTALLLVDLNQFRGVIQSQFEKSLRREVALGAIGLKLLPLAVRVDDLSVAEDPAFSTGKPFATVKRMYVRVGLIPLLQRRLVVDSAVFESPAVELIKNKEGSWNFATLAAASNSGTGAGDAGAPPISLQQLQVENGAVTVTDRQSGKPPSLYDRIALRVDDHVPGGAFKAEGSAHLQGNRKEEVTFQLTGLGAAGMDGSFTVREVSAGPAAISGNGTFRSRGSEVHVQSSLEAVDPRLSPLRIESTARYDRTSSKVTIAPLEIRMDGLTIRGAAESDMAAGPVTYRADLHSENAPVAGLLKVANALQPGQDATGDGTATISLRLQGKGGTLAYAGTVVVPEASIVPSKGAEAVHVQSANIRLTSSEPLTGQIGAGKLSSDRISLTDVTSGFQFTDGVLHLENLRARGVGGEIAGNLSVATGGPNARLTANAKLSAVDASQFLAAAAGVKTLSGKLSGDADLQMPPDRNAVRGLNGTARFLFTDGRIPGAHMLDQLAQVGKFVGYTKTGEGGFTSVSKLAGSLRIQSGVARTDDLQLDFDGGSLSAAGTADLSAETLDLDVTAVLTKDVSERVGGSKVGGFMNTVMANAKGELIVPAKVTGSFSSPRFSPDPSRLVKMRFGDVNKAAGTAQTLLEKLTGPRTGKKEGEPSPADKAKPFTDLLKSIGKKK